MKSKKIVLSIFCVIALMFLLTGCRSLEMYEKGDFRYQEDDSGDEPYIVIYGLSSTGMQKKDIVIPTEINNIPVKQFGAHYMWGRRDGKFESAHLEKMFMQSNVSNSSTRMYEWCYFLKKIIYIPTDISLDNIEQLNENLESRTKGHQTEPYDSFFYFYSDADQRIVSLKICNGSQEIGNNFADLQYNYNYENSPNSGVYWLDDYDNELISYMPINPEREGFSFLGWYTDSECTNEWDFTNDQIPKKEYELTNDSDDAYTYYKYYYNKTNLYAKWLSR